MNIHEEKAAAAEAIASMIDKRPGVETFEQLLALGGAVAEDAVLLSYVMRFGRDLGAERYYRQRVRVQ